MTGNALRVAFVLRSKSGDPFRVNRSNQLTLAAAARRTGLDAVALDVDAADFRTGILAWAKLGPRPVIFCWGKTLDRIPPELSGIPILCRDGNPPWYLSGDENYVVVAGKILLHIDRDSLDYTSALNRAPARAASEFWADDGAAPAAATPVSKRPIPFVAAIRAAKSHDRNREWLAAQPRPIHDLIEAVCAEGRRTFRASIPSIAAQILRTGGMRLDLLGTVGRGVLEHCTRRLTTAERLDLLAAARHVPGVIVTDGPLPDVAMHSGTRIVPAMAFPQLLRLFGEARCVLTHMPQRMTGALSERVHNAGLRGAFTILPRSSAVLRDPAFAPMLMAFDPGAEAVPDLLAEVTDRPAALDALQPAMMAMTRELFSPERAIGEMLAHAPE